MGFCERIDVRGVRETERPVSFIPKGALTHHPEGAVVLPTATVRSARQMRLLREPYGQCHITAVVLSLSTQSAILPYLQNVGLGHFDPDHLRQLPAKICHRQFYRSYGYRLPQYPFSFCEKETKTKSERTVRTNGDLSLGGEGSQPRYRALRCGSFRISELQQYPQ